MLPAIMQTGVVLLIVSFEQFQGKVRNEFLAFIIEGDKIQRPAAPLAYASCASLLEKRHYRKVEVSAGTVESPNAIVLTLPDFATKMTLAIAHNFRVEVWQSTD